MLSKEDLTIYYKFKKLRREMFENHLKIGAKEKEE